MKRLLGMLALSLAACSVEPAKTSQPQIFGLWETKGPNVNDQVKPNQEQWLVGQVQNPDALQIEKMLVFGDSLSDPGNLNKRTLGLFIPPQIYYKSRLSNGPIWSDYTNTALGWAIENYAVAGAETRTNGLQELIAVPSFLQQITENTFKLKNMNKAKTLVVVWIGANNYFVNGGKAQDDNGIPIAEIVQAQSTAAIADIKEGILKLKGMGFRQFVIGTMPELGGLNRNPKSPFPASDATFFAATAAHNAGLRAMVQDLQSKAPDASLTIFQGFEINQKTIDAPQDFGFTRLNAPCFVGSLQGKFDGEKTFCADPSGYKFWEYVHPNTKMHCYYASQFLDDLQMAGKIQGFDRASSIDRCQAL